MGSRDTQDGACVFAVGLMSGTSMDGIDAAILETDGEGVIRPIAAETFPYTNPLRQDLQDALDGAAASGEKSSHFAGLEAQITRLHAQAVKTIAQRVAAPIACIGFHGQTILHRPDKSLTWQLGDGQLLADLTGYKTVWDFRSADVAAGGQGAPLACAYHAAIAQVKDLELPVAFLNLGGVANVTWVGTDGGLQAMDCGPANALMDMWAQQFDLGNYDAGGQVAARGAVRQDILTGMADNPFFDLPPPKSLDRLDFDLGAVRGLPVADGMATLAAFTAECVWMAQTHFPAPVRRWYVTGGGRLNPTLMGLLSERLSAPVDAIDATGFDGDSLEAEAFAYLAVRRIKGLPISWPGTTGVPRPMTGGQIT